MKFKIENIYRAWLFWLPVRCDLFLQSTCSAPFHFILPPVSLGKKSMLWHRALHMDSPVFPTELSYSVLLITSGMQGFGVFWWSSIRGRISVEESWLLLVHRGFCMLIKIDKQRQSPPSDAPWPAAIALGLEADKSLFIRWWLNYPHPECASSRKHQQSTHTGQRSSCAKPSSLNAEIQ